MSARFSAAARTRTCTRVPVGTDGFSRSRISSTSTPPGLVMTTALICRSHNKTIGTQERKLLRVFLNGRCQRFKFFGRSWIGPWYCSFACQGSKSPAHLSGRAHVGGTSFGQEPLTSIALLTSNLRTLQDANSHHHQQSGRQSTLCVANNSETTCCCEG